VLISTNPFTHLVEDDWQLASTKHELWTFGRMRMEKSHTIQEHRFI